ncbi:MAG: sodium:solute symporter family protein, partial [Bacteroidota bacterium]
MFGFQIVDIIAIALYFIVILGIGYYASRRIKNQEDYFLGGRRFGKFIQTFAAFGQGTSAENAVGMSVVVARNGLAGVLQQIIGIFHLPFFWITSIWYRRLRTITLGDFFEERFNSKGLAAFYAIVSAFFFMIVIGLGFIAMSRTISAISEKPVTELTVEEKQEYQKALELEQLEEKDYRLLTPREEVRLEELRIDKPRKEFSYISETFIIWFVALIVILYAGFGGLEAAFLSDTLQGILILILSLLLLPFAFIKIQNVFGVEGLSGVINVAKSKLPESTFDVWGSPAMTDFTWYYLLAIMITLLITTCVQANQLVATASAKDEYTARAGFTSGIYLKRAATLFWGITAMLLIILYAKHLGNPDYLWGVASRDLLGSLGIGLLGLMVAALLAALMSTATALMITASSLLTHNLVRPIFPGYKEKTYVRIGAFMGIIIIVGG